MMASSHFDYLVIGSGVFGASTAYHLCISHPEASVALVDRCASFPCSLAASHDYNKIVRADYGNAFYCKLALEAREAWKNDPLYKPYYHQPGMIVLDDTGLARKIIDNYAALDSNSEAMLLTKGDMKKMYDGLFEDADYGGVDDIFLNPQSGWAEATLAVEKVIEVAVSKGLMCLQGDVTKLLFDNSGACIGVNLQGGNTLCTSKLILSTGAGTAKLLADSAPNRAELQSGGRITAAAVITGVVKLTPKQMERFGKAPAFIHSMGDVLGECLAPTPRGILKFCVDVSFKNTSLHQASGQMISAPPDQLDYAQHTIPKQLKDECARVVNGIYGKELEDYKFDSFRICWDGITPNQDFIISPHPQCKSLYIATGGSFHGWKFLPLIGKYIVQMLDGNLEQDLVKRWAWDREQTGSAHETVMPKRELKDILDV